MPRRIRPPSDTCPALLDQSAPSSQLGWAYLLVSKYALGPRAEVSEFLHICWSANMSDPGPSTSRQAPPPWSHPPFTPAKKGCELSEVRPEALPLGCNKQSQDEGRNGYFELGPPVLESGHHLADQSRFRS